MINMTKLVRTLPIQLLLLIALSTLLSPNALAQVASHPEAKSPMPENPYLKHTDPWRWDVRSQIFLRASRQVYYEPGQPITGENERERTRQWPMQDLEVIYPVLRTGGFYWSPNEETKVSIRVDDVKLKPDPVRMYTKGTRAEYTLWRSDVKDYINAIHLIHDSHIVVADTIFDHKKAQHLPWPDKWDTPTKAFLTPVVDSVGEEVAVDAPDTIKILLDFWVEDKDPKGISELDLVKFLTGKVIEHVQVRGPPAEFSTRSGNRLSPIFTGGTTWSGFVVRPADVVAREPNGTKHDLATLLTAVLRSAGVPARTVLCVDRTENDVLEKMVSMVEFAMYDPERDFTFWVPIDVDKLRLTGKRAAQYKQWWNYFGTHDELNDYVPVAYYFHPPASYRAYDLPALYGIRSSSPLPEYIIQAVLIDPQMSPISAPKKK